MIEIGLSTALIKDFLGFTLEPFLTQRVHDLIPLDYDSCQYPSNKDLVPALIRTITTDCVFGVVFSPFDILRTRMIVQSSSHQTYKGPLRGLIKVTKEYTMKHLKLALMFASFKSITRHLKFILFDIFDGWQKVVFDLVWDIGEVALGCIVETVVRRGYLQGFEGQSVVPYQRARKVDTIKTDKRYLLRGLKMRVGMLLLHKVIGGLVVNLDIDEE